MFDALSDLVTTAIDGTVVGMTAYPAQAAAALVVLGLLGLIAAWVNATDRRTTEDRSLLTNAIAYGLLGLATLATSFWAWQRDAAQVRSSIVFGAWLVVAIVVANLLRPLIVAAVNAVTQRQRTSRPSAIPAAVQVPTSGPTVKHHAPHRARRGGHATSPASSPYRPAS